MTLWPTGGAVIITQRPGEGMERDRQPNSFAAASSHDYTVILWPWTFINNEEDVFPVFAQKQAINQQRQELRKTGNRSEGFKFSNQLPLNRE